MTFSADDFVKIEARRQALVQQYITQRDERRAREKGEAMTEDELQAIEARYAEAVPDGIVDMGAQATHDLVADVPALVAEVRRLREALVEAWDAGFYASGEGWNGEYPFNHPGRPTTEEEKRLREQREEALTSLMTMT